MKKLLLPFFLVAFLFAEAQVTHQVAVTNNVFTPADITIEVGDTVEWTCTQGSHNVNGTTSTYPSNPESFGNSVAPATWTYYHVFNAAGDYDYQCDPHLALGMTGTITVIPCSDPVIEFTSSINNLTVDFTNTTVDDLTGQLWDFGDGATSFQENPQHTYAAAGTYTVCLTGTDNCGTDSTCQTVTVSCPIAESEFSTSSNGLSVTFTDQSLYNPTFWLWDFGDGNTVTQQSPNHSYVASGNYTVCLTVVNDCGADSSCQAVSVTVPSNDDCANATLLAVGSSCTMQSYDSQNHTAENPQPAPPPGCGFFQGSDVWFRAVVPASGALRVERNNGSINGSINAQFAVYSGTCGNMEVVTCAQLDAARTIHRPDLAGQEVFIRVWNYNSSNGGTFNLCVWEPEIPVNNYCSDAIPLTVGQTCDLDTFTCVYATADTTQNQPNPGCGFYQGGDVWFTFDLPASGELRIERQNISGNAQYAVYDGTCGNFEVLDCAQLDGETTLVLPDQAGQTLYLRVWGYNTEEGAEFAICLWDPPIPANDLCADAINLPVGQNCTLQQFSGFYATPDSSGTAPSPGCGFYQGGDIWFTFDMPASGELRIDRNNIDGNAQYAVYDGVCGNMEVVDCAQLDGGTTLVLPNLAGETLYLRVFGYNTEEGSEFEICLWDPPVPVNDLCANAIPLPVGDSCVFSAFSSRYATTDTVGTAPSPGCGFYQGGDVWFTVEMPATGMLHLERDNIDGNAQFALYDGTCGNFNSVISCAQLTSEMEVNDQSLAGETLYLRVFGYNSEEGAEFEFCAYDTTCNSFEATITQVGNELWANPTGWSFVWLGCSPTPDPLAVTATYEPSASGDYRVLIYHPNGCSDTSDCINVTVTGLDETLESEFDVYPNPSTAVFEVVLNQVQNVSWRVLDITGKAILKDQTTTDRFMLDLSDFADGIYSLRISTSAGSVTQKLLLQR